MSQSSPKKSIRESEMVRIFLAIYPPRDIASQLLKILQTYDLPKHRETPIEQLHITLHFVGNVRNRDLDKTIETATHAKKGLFGFQVQIKKLIVLPCAPAKPRLIAAETTAPADLLELQRRVASRFARASRQQPGDKYRPHLTLCRFHPGVERNAQMPPLPPTLDTDISFDVASFHIMKSTLRPQGAHHESIAKMPMVMRS